MKPTSLLAQTDFFRVIRSSFESAADRPGLALIEMLLIGGVVYGVLRFLQGTRGARLVRAVFTILVVSFAAVWFLAEYLASEKIKILYSYFMLGVFLISLVAFQSELRRMLLRLGDRGLLRRFVKSSNAAIDPVADAVARLSKKKIGALLALDRSGEIGGLIESGVSLDAMVTAELLETIFWPGSALHDLGVVIHADRIVAAGCQFPLAESGEIDRALGSRHRAAVGMSQETEAIVIVVSEETGTISVAIRGRLRRALNPESLRELLNTEFVNDPQRAQRAQTPAPAGSKATAKVRTDGTGQAA